MPADYSDALAASSASSYTILAKLATGGMAELFLARTASAAGVERYVVLKRVLPAKLADHDFVAMFLDEARLVAQLQHPNIAQVFDTGKLGESYFFSMEYVHGETVRELVSRARERGVAIPVGCALTIAANAAAGLHHAHERIGIDGRPLGIVHRDVSPSNLMVSFEGNVKLVDFGVAKTARARSVDTITGTVRGKIGYLSPEQCRGRTSDRRGDLFSLGIVMWELLVGERLFKRDNDYDTMEAIVLAPTPAPSTLRPDVPPELDAIVLKLLAKAPGDRYQTADELTDELERVGEATDLRISNATLKRFVAEMFGKRPEPWIEIQHGDRAAEIVTVTAAVSGADTTVTVLDTQLSSLIDLTQSRTVAQPVHRFAPIDVAPVPRSHMRAIAVTVLAAIASGVVAWSWLAHSAPAPIVPHVPVEAVDRRAVVTPPARVATPAAPRPPPSKIEPPPTSKASPRGHASIKKATCASDPSLCRALEPTPTPTPTSKTCDDPMECRK